MNQQGSTSLSLMLGAAVLPAVEADSYQLVKLLGAAVLPEQQSCLQAAGGSTSDGMSIGMPGVNGYGVASQAKPSQAKPSHAKSSQGVSTERGHGAAAAGGESLGDLALRLARDWDPNRNGTISRMEVRELCGPRVVLET